MSVNAELEEVDEIEVEMEAAGDVNDDPLAIIEQDDTPAEDKDKTPMPKEIVEELEADELEEYSDKVKQRLKQMKKVWHDERRAKEEILREQSESVAFTRRLMKENQYLKSKFSEGEQTLVDTYKEAATLELEKAKREYKEAYDSGDSDKVVEAQQALNAANMKLSKADSYTPTLQTEQNVLYNKQTSESGGTQVTPQKPDDKTLAWQKRNPWYGNENEPEMTALALGYHQKLERARGKQYVGTDEYWNDIDSMMRQRFPEKFEGTASTDETDSGGGKPAGTQTPSKPASVVASASRSTAPKRIVLKRSQVALAKKLGISPEDYAKEVMKLETQHGR
jgi:hypothetical protein